MNHLVFGVFFAASALTLAIFVNVEVLRRKVRDTFTEFFHPLYAGMTGNVTALAAVQYVFNVSNDVPTVGLAILAASVNLSIFFTAAMIGLSAHRLVFARHRARDWAVILLSGSLGVASLFSAGFQPPSTIVWNEVKFSVLWLPAMMVYALGHGGWALLRSPRSLRFTIVSMIVATSIFLPFSVLSFWDLLGARTTTLPPRFLRWLPIAVFILICAVLFGIEANRRYFRGRDSQPVPLTLEGLSPRERDVVRLVSAGKDNKSIAAELGVSVFTVKAHLATVFRKLGIQSRFELIARVK